MPDLGLVETVDRSASEQDIKKAYKRLSRKYHPDKNHEPGAEDKFVEVAHGEYIPVSFSQLRLQKSDTARPSI